MNQSLHIADLMTFLDASPTAWHAAESAKSRLKASSFLEISGHNRWNIKPQQRYVLLHNGTSLCAFVTPKKMPKRIRLLASHTDSPALKLKPQPEIRRFGSILLGVEIYGSPLLTSWLNRDLGIAGQILYEDRQGQLKNSLVICDRYPVTIPQLAIHLDREVNEKGLLLNKQEHLNALAGLERDFDSDFSFLESLLRECVDFKRLIAHDLMLFPLEKARLVGFQDAFLASYRIDSLASLHAAMAALLKQSAPLEDEIKMILFWDNEEVGSSTAQGAQSPFFTQVLERIVEGFRGTREDYFCLINQSVCLSIDLAHALHPNYPERSDPSHSPKLGEGIVLKSNAGQRYATNALSSLPVRVIAANNKIPMQTFVSRNDMPCGSTIGPLLAAQSGMAAADIGCGQLSMHSCRELLACQDQIDMCRLLEGIFQAPDWPE